MRVATELYCIAALGVLFSVVALLSTSVPPDDPVRNSGHQLKKLAMAIDGYFINTGELPKELGQLLDANRGGWDGPYARSEDLVDPWGDPIRYQIVAGPAPGYRLECVCQGQPIALSN